MKKVKILVVDDEEAIRRNFKIQLEDYGHFVMLAKDGKEALEIFSKERPNIVLTDLRMPEMDGTTLISQLKKIDSKIPIIVVSGTGNIKEAIDSINYGAWDYLLKPLQETGEVEIVIKRNLERAALLIDNQNYLKNLEGAVIQKSREVWESELRFRTLIEQSPLAMTLVRNDRINYLNGVAIKTYGFNNMEDGI